MFVPLHELVDEGEVRLDDDVEAAGADEAAMDQGAGREGARASALKNILWDY